LSNGVFVRFFVRRFFSIIDIRLFSFECTGSVASRKRNRFVISIIDSIENNGNECRFKHAALDGIYYKNEDELNPAL
jgi:hypothetical protein